MLKKVRNCSLLLLLILNVKAQNNLIPNPGFEEQVACPQTLGDFHVASWFSTLKNLCSPDYYSTCADKDDYSSPESFIIDVAPSKGKSFVGLVGYNPIQDYREYISVRLKTPLVKQQEYTFKISLSQPAMSVLYIYELGVLFTDKPVDIGSVERRIIAKPDILFELPGGLQLTDGWEEFELKYTAQGGEEYLTLGCFTHKDQINCRTYEGRRNFYNDYGYSDAYYLFDNLQLYADSLLQPATPKLDSAVFDQKPIEIFTFKDVKFETGKHVANEEKHLRQFDELIAYLKKEPKNYIKIEGHTDDVGNDEDNLSLSKRRAKFVKEYFISKGISSFQIISEGYGESQPMETNQTVNGKAENRRVVVKVYEPLR